ncbi:MAG: hypothetical protein CSA53_01510 [Gammaproteobacteria bacterium]|nr:MAG: hypothetical protein CSA53_01510 [Gammaproteobacteria bacterium]
MAGTSLLVLIDDIAALLDDVSIMTKLAAKKTAGVLGDDLALNAQQVTGVTADRELPVVWAVAKGSFVNKLILVPAALLISAFVPWLITPLMMLGGLFLCFEGFEKVWHVLFDEKAQKQAEHQALVDKLNDPEQDPVEFEKAKIKGAIRTDFILSAEIIVLTLGLLQESEFAVRVAVLSCVAIGMTVFVYGLVAGIVKLDDAGLHLLGTEEDKPLSGLRRALGRGLLSFAPFLMKALGFFGTLAMFLVGGGILVHSIHAVEVPIEKVSEYLHTLGSAGDIAAAVWPTLATGIVGVIAGGIVVAVFTLIQKLRGAPAEH